MATLIKDKRTGAYKARVKALDGTTKTISTRETDKAKARRILSQSRLAEIEEAGKAGKLQKEGLNQILGSQKVTVSSASDGFIEWLTTNGRSPIYIHQVRSVLNTFIAECKLEDVLIQDLTEKHINDVVNKDAPGGAAWRRTKLSILRSFCDLVSARGWRNGNPARCVRVQMHKLSHAQKEKKEPQPFTDQEVDELLRRTKKGEFWHTAIALSRYTGLRLGDVTQMEWDSLTVPGKIIVWTDKRDRRVVLPVPEVLEKAIRSLPWGTQMKYLFPHEREMYLDPKTRPNLSTYFRRICHGAGIKGKTFHDLRSSYCEACARAGVPIEHIAVNVGHVNTSTTMGYMPNVRRKGVE